MPSAGPAAPLAVLAGARGSVVDDDRLRPLSLAERERYSRNMLVPGVGVVGQQRIRAARVLLVGAGGLGSPAALYLAAAGVGTLGIVDDDRVALSNLQRQVIHRCGDVGVAKVDSARRAVAELNPDVEVVTYPVALTSANAMEVLAGWDVVIDGTDNFPTRYLVGDACVLAGIPLVHGAVYRFDGQVSVFDSRRGPCYRCLHPAPPPADAVPSCAQGGVLGVLPGLVGTLQATEALKLVVGGGEPLVGRILMVSAWRARYEEVAVVRNPDCPVCGKHPTVTGLIDYEQFCGLRLPEDGTSDEEVTMKEISAVQLREVLAGGSASDGAGGGMPLVLDVREPHEVEVVHIDGSVNVPLGQVVERMGELDPGRTTVVTCAAGIRSAKAITALAEAGYAGELINLTGGMKAWQESARE